MNPTVRSERKSRGLTLQELSVLAFVDTATLSLAERGVRRLSNDQIKRIAEALSVDSTALRNGQEALVESFRSQLRERISRTSGSGIAVAATSGR